MHVFRGGGERQRVKDEERQREEGGLILASCLCSLQQRQISHVTPNRHRHPLPTLRLTPPHSRRRERPLPTFGWRRIALRCLVLMDYNGITPQDWEVCLCSGIYRNLTICHSPFPHSCSRRCPESMCPFFFSRGLIKTLIPYLKFSLVILLQYTSNQMQASNKAEARGCSKELSATKIPTPNHHMGANIKPWKSEEGLGDWRMKCFVEDWQQRSFQGLQGFGFSKSLNDRGSNRKICVTWGQDFGRTPSASRWWMITDVHLRFPFSLQELLDWDSWPCWPVEKCPFR